jgi:hypothetical protein
MALPPGTSGWVGSGFDCQEDCAGECCPLPVIIFSNVSSTNLDYFISDADSATITYQCGSDAEVETAITLTDRMASGNYTTTDTECLVTIEATNSCGTTIKYWRNYDVPKQCDCIDVANDPPSLWRTAGGVLVTISGTTTAVQIGGGGIVLCASPTSCGDPTGSVAFYCPQPSRKFIVTSSTGCGTYYFYIDIFVSAGYINWNNAFPQFTFNVEIRSGLFQRASGGNPYPTLTEYTGTFGTDWKTPLSPGITGQSQRYTRSVLGSHASSVAFAGGASRMLGCYVGSIAVTSDTDATTTDTGHCDCGGLTITAEVV